MRGALLLTWDDFMDAVLAGVQDVTLSPWFKNCPGVYGIPRGGLVLAVAFSHHLKIPMLLKPADRCLVVDDCFETGHTYLKLIAKTGVKDVAGWVWINKNPTLNQNYYRFVDPDTWVVFPWEDYMAAEKDKTDYERRTPR